MRYADWPMFAFRRRDVLSQSGEQWGRSGMRLLTVAAHPDDETLGAGGTMAWHA